MSRRSRGKLRPGAPRIGDSDSDLFERTMSGVEPLKKKRAFEPAAGPDLQSAGGPVSTNASRRRTVPPIQKEPATPEPPPLSADSFAGVDRRTVERMRRGKLPIDARLDLHGHYQDAAHAELNAFIASCAATGCRLVLVITGKGSVGEGGGVLRRRLPDWLNQPTCRPYVLAFSSARPEHGGAGAFYVLLRRQRDRRK